MPNLTHEDILSLLRSVVDPERDQDVVTLGMISGIQVRDGHVAFTIEVDPARAGQYEPLRKRCEEAVFGAPGVLSATAVLTAQGGARPEASKAPPNAPKAPNTSKAPAAQAAPGGGSQKTGIPGVRAIMAVASGKGGVGKSTTAVNLAMALKKMGLGVGLLDADVYGPSLPRMMGLSGRPDSADGKIIEPKVAYGVPCMSIGFMVEDDTPMIWRGPMVMGAVEQLLRDVRWGELDVLIIDMPPGTGDAQLTIAQRVPLAGALIVSTPQDVALSDVRKGLNMFRKVEVPVFGIVENMSYFLCPRCGERTEIFGHGGARQTAAELGADFLGEIPLHLAIRETSDAGTPIVVVQPDSAHAKAYLALAERVAEKLEESLDALAAAAPKIIVE
ncbi:MAG: Mrp/NBP35 family ATP-binding protein [Proteobacteria bacterium]|nr:Mrp/NBP35 family ATP-binding protein [Pseudomonadota bacterium]